MKPKITLWYANAVRQRIKEILILKKQSKHEISHVIADYKIDELKGILIIFEREEKALNLRFRMQEKFLKKYKDKNKAVDMFNDWHSKQDNDWIDKYDEV